jgi:hypothetical protein
LSGNEINQVNATPGRDEVENHSRTSSLMKKKKMMLKSIESESERLRSLRLVDMTL